MLVFAFDTATEVATAALVDLAERECVAERLSRTVRILADADGLLEESGLDRSAIEGLVVGTGPGSYTGLRMGLVTARTLAFALEVPVAGVSTLAALAHGAPGARPLMDGRRGEVFTLEDDAPVVLAAEALRIRPKATYVADGAVRYRGRLE